MFDEVNIILINYLVWHECKWKKLTIRIIIIEWESEFKSNVTIILTGNSKSKWNGISYLTIKFCWKWKSKSIRSNSLSIILK